ncbi:hypothetical protein [Fusobacterium varium]|uniref:hypothetical protein n=1 Tax=Fusobacterium varium TaxID=856 RepID=UPI00242ED9AC|nr:hypothetical protein [Fusobacterium varium]
MQNLEYQNYELKDLVINIMGNELSQTEYDLKNFKISSSVNHHTILNMEIEILISEKNKYIQINRNVDGDIIVAMKTLIGDKSEEIIFFTGKIINSSLIRIGRERYFLKIEAFSLSEIMDRVKKYRAFQNIEMTFKEVITQIFDEYKISYLLNNEKLNSAIKAPLIQFKETDWEFLIRTISRLGLGAFNLASGSIGIGFSQSSSKKKKYDAERGRLGITRRRNQSLGYTVETEQSYSLGDIVHIQSEDITVAAHVTAGNMIYNSGRFEGEYELEVPEYIYPYIPNNNIKGCVIEASVEKVFERSQIAVMIVDLSSGLNKYANLRLRTTENLKDYPDKNGRFVFPYTTPYSQSNTGYFCTPETNDIVAVYFPTNEEECGYVLWAVNNPGNGRFSNPDVRNYTLPIESNAESYFDFRLNHNEYKVYSEFLLDLRTKDTMNLSSENLMTMKSVNDYLMSVDENMSIVGKNMSMKSNISKEVVLEEKKEIMETLASKYLTSYRIDAKNMETVVQGRNFTQASKIFKKS